MYLYHWVSKKKTISLQYKLFVLKFKINSTCYAIILRQRGQVSADKTNQRDIRGITQGYWYLTL